MLNFLNKGDIKPFKGINKSSLYEHGYIKHDKERKEIDQWTHFLYQVETFLWISSHKWSILKHSWKPYIRHWESFLSSVFYERWKALERIGEAYCLYNCSTISWIISRTYVESFNSIKLCWIVSITYFCQIIWIIILSRFGTSQLSQVQF